MAIDVLLVDDSAGDVRLTREAFRESRSRIRLHAVLRKRFDLDSSEALMRSIDDFWFSKVKLPLARPTTDVEGAVPS